MIIFHEGLPGSGKSYEAMARRIIPALQAGRTVQAYIEGLDFERIAQASGVDLAKVQQLLHPITREQVQSDGEERGKRVTVDHLPELCQDNALVVIDEAQNFWPNRARLDDAMTQFVTEHRHRGIDIVLMGQDLRDVHALWRRRVETKDCFLKLSVFGTGSRYSVTTYRHKGGDLFDRLSSKVHKYDPRYFGCYASHTNDNIKTDDYKDGRGTLWSMPAVRYGVPLLAVAAVWAVFNVRAFFSGDWTKGPQAAASAPVQLSAPGAPAQAPRPGQMAAAPALPASGPPPSLQERKLAALSTQYRVRLAGVLSLGERVQGVVEWVEGGQRVAERLTFDDLRLLGVSIVQIGGVVRLTLGGWSDLASPWPMEVLGRASAAVQERVAGPRPVTLESGTVVSVPASRPAPPQRVEMPSGIPPGFRPSPRS